MQDLQHQRHHASTHNIYIFQRCFVSGHANREGEVFFLSHKCLFLLLFLRFIPCLMGFASWALRMCPISCCLYLAQCFCRNLVDAVMFVGIWAPNRDDTTIFILFCFSFSLFYYPKEQFNNMDECGAFRAKFFVGNWVKWSVASGGFLPKPNIRTKVAIILRWIFTYVEIMILVSEVEEEVVGGIMFSQDKVKFVNWWIQASVPVGYTILYW